MDWMEKNMATKKPGKKSAKQVKLEQKIASLKKEHDKFSKQKRALQKVLDREGKTREKQLDRLDKAIDRAQKAYDKLDEKDLPSGPKSRKLTDQLYKIEDKIRAGENDLRALASQETAAKKAAPDREAGEETEE